MKQELTCIVCPMGCHIEADCEVSADGALTVGSVTGNTCPRGERYARSELTHPERMVTGTVILRQGRHARLPVITSAPVPREKIFDVMAQIHSVSVCAPVKIHDIIIRDVCGLGVDIVAARSVERMTQSA